MRVGIQTLSLAQEKRCPLPYGYPGKPEKQEVAAELGIVQDGGIKRKGKVVTLQPVVKQ